MSKHTCLEIAEAGGLECAFERGDEVFHHCRNHDDQRASFRIHRKKDCWKCDPCGTGGNAWELMAFLAGCNPDDKQAVLAWRDAHGLNGTNGNGNGHKPSREIVEVYDYQNAARELVSQTIRYSPKGFSQRRPNGNGGYIYNLHGVELVPYRLPELLAADPSLPVFILEGEKDVDAILERGGIATCNPMGAGKWRKDYSKYLVGRHCVVLPDNDDAGKKHGTDVAVSLVKHGAATVKVLALPDLPPKGDVSDYLEQGHSFDELIKLAEAAPLSSVDGSDDEARPILIRFSDVQPKPIDWIWPKRLAIGKMTLVIGDPGLGKSGITIDAASRITRGAKWPDGTVAPRGNVIILSCEDNAGDTIRPRIDRYGGDPSKIFALQGIREGGVERFFCLADDLSQLERAIDDVGDVVLIIIDPVSAYLGSKDSYKDSEIRGVLGPLASLAERRGVAVLGVMHLTKNNQQQALYRAPGSIAFIAAARMVFCVGKDPDNSDRRIMAHVKNNISTPPPSLAFEFVDDMLVWNSEPTNITADAILAGPHSIEERAARQDAAEFLRELLAESPVQSKKIFKDARDNGFSEATIRRAKEKLNIHTFHVGKPGDRDQSWYWQLSNDKTVSTGVSEVI
jgi:hypothetical protein